MDLLRPLKKSATIVGLLADLDFIFLKLPMILVRKNRVNSYLAANETARLHLGAGQSKNKGWLLTDIKAPPFRGLTYLNAAKPFPFKDETFDYIFSEHMIEHINREQGTDMLKECYRVLKPGGVLRVATPDLDAFLGLASEELNDDQHHYVKWISDNFLTSGHNYRAKLVVNNAFYNWGHAFIYDQKTLQDSMEETGYEQIKRCEVGKSVHSCLQNLESHGTNIDEREVNIFETMVLEASKPL
ncbi:MAG: methyltransferase domain-containing protein [Desulfocapsa sp.]|nr:methyltransferase domain-containing protein [Desulfocapsa sp.]